MLAALPGLAFAILTSPLSFAAWVADDDRSVAPPLSLAALTGVVSGICSVWLLGRVAPQLELSFGMQLLTVLISVPELLFLTWVFSLPFLVAGFAFGVQGMRFGQALRISAGLGWIETALTLPMIVLGEIFGPWGIAVGALATLLYGLYAVARVYIDGLEGSATGTWVVAGILAALALVGTVSSGVGLARVQRQEQERRAVAERKAVEAEETARLQEAQRVEQNARRRAMEEEAAKAKAEAEATWSVTLNSVPPGAMVTVVNTDEVLGITPTTASFPMSQRVVSVDFLREGVRVQKDLTQDDPSNVIVVMPTVE